MTVTPESPSVPPATPSKPLTSLRSRQGLMDELDSLRSRFLHEDTLSLASSSTEPSNIEESKYASLQGELEADAQDLEGDSWSLEVDQDYLKPMSKESIKRQDVIYELIQTESHHVRTLKILLCVYRNELIESAPVDEARLKRLFYGLDGLLGLHAALLQGLKQRRLESMVEGSPHNYQIRQLADILTAQFSGELGERMKNFYGAFCYYHRDAVTFYKDLLQSNKKFQAHMRKVGQLSIVRRLGIPECFLLVTQRITKYPVLVERIIQNTEETEEQTALALALTQIRDCISQVDGQVSDFKNAARLRDIAQRLEPKSQCLLKDGRQFSREDLTEASRTLQNEATFTIKESSGKLKEVQALLLTDVLILLQEKDQKLAFKTMQDNKSPVIFLQSLIVREVAHEEKAMFLICASSDNYVMYEIHTRSKAERNTWMALIRQAVESCPILEVKSQEEEEARSTKLKEFQETLARRDMLIEKNLQEKLQIFAFFTENLTGVETPQKRLLLRGDASDLQQGETLIMGAIRDVEGLQDLLLARIRDPNQAADDSQGPPLLLRRAQTFGGFETRPPGQPAEDAEGASGQDDPLENGRLSTSSDPEHPDPERSDPVHKDLERLDPEQRHTERHEPEHHDGENLDHDLDPEHHAESRELSADDETPIQNPDSPRLSAADLELFNRVLQLSNRLYSLQAIIAQQDSRADLQQLRWLTAPASSGGAAAAAGGAGGSRRDSGGLLLEQERQRTLEKQREEQAAFQRQQAAHRQEAQRWEKERERQRVHALRQEAELAAGAEEHVRRDGRLAAERAELEAQRAAYQGDLVRLRESAQKVERERQLLETQQLKQQKQSDQFLRATQSFSVAQRRVSPDPHIHPTNHVHNHVHHPHHHHHGGHGGGGGGGGEVPPLVPPRRHSMSPKPVVVVPLQLVSTTNQPHKEGGVQQQIPTKLAVHSKAKSTKSSKGHHRGSHQRAASIDMSQVVPIKVTGNEGGSLRAVSKASPSPQVINSDRFTRPTPPINVKPSPSFSTHIRSPDPPPPPPPPFPKDLLKKEKKREVFL
ncbi:rho guanine nucleotide exchange factor 18a isoform X1 [Gadus macrocephalus]|uniref:rho guanine nucleotide exchange factor 18a isoform X1 n=1 Tax=Gadus macrocephalus TaxID=80720 RepID=UPI0028CB3ACD|nr:rho guanine nucleotide exchange factor 18a isoform X1 [Gadus macrocephalus]